MNTKINIDDTNLHFVKVETVKRKPKNEVIETHYKRFRSIYNAERFKFDVNFDEEIGNEYKRATVIKSRPKEAL